MKKVLVIMMFLIAPAALFSQISAGVQIGYNATQLTSDWGDINNNLSSGFQIGVFARLGDKFFLQPELLYASRGGYSEFQSDVMGTGSNDVHYGMFQLPVLLGMKILDGDLIGANIQAGPVVSLLTDKGVTGVGKIFDKENFKDVAWGVQVGAGIDVMSFMLNIRYEIALSDIYDGQPPGGGTSFSAKANTFLVTLGWKIL